MDAQERRAAFSGLYTRFRADSQQNQSDDDGVSDDVSASSPSDLDTPSPSPQLPPESVRSPSPLPLTTNHDGDISSDASTVKPPDHSDPLSYQSPVPDSPPASSTPSTLPPPSLPPPSPICPLPPPTPPTTRSPTIPPLSPHILPQPADPPVAAVIVQVPYEDCALDTTLSPARSISPSRQPYPRFPDSHFRFNRDGQSSITDLFLSDNPRARHVEVPPASGYVPAAVANELSDFQRDGVTFLYRLYERGRGGLLADAMGLGKTVQTICFLGAAFGIWDRVLDQFDRPVNGFFPRILVVVPTSVRENWKREFQCWTPFRVLLYERTEEPSISRAFRKATADILITGDSLIWKNPSFFKDPLGDASWKWHVVIVDEIHVAKNANTKIYKSLKALPKVAMFGLTGTAVQNRLRELWNVLSLVVPQNHLPLYKSFRTYFIDAINKGTKKDASVFLRQKANQRITQLRKLLSKHMVRRPKSIIDAQLPGKTDYCVLMRMKRNGLQGHMYQRFQNSYDVKLLRDAKLPCDCGSEEMSKECCHRYPTTKRLLADAPIWRLHHKEEGPCDKCPNCICLSVQHYSRCIAAHALLILPEDDEPDRRKADNRRELFRYYLGDRADGPARPLVKMEEEQNVSCKLNVALKLIKKFEANGHKTIIFYESLRLGSILQRWATNNRLTYEVIDGSVNKGARQTAVDRFNTDKIRSVFFISKKAGGTGLNICGADRVLIFEPCWNPTLDLQAGDRAHRLGQRRVVQMIRLVVENTIEHYVMKTAISKSQVSNAILDNTKEEWRIREGEVGTMHAMLSMGDAFTDRESQSEQYDVMEAIQLNKETMGSDDRRKKREDASYFGNSDEEAEEESASVDILGNEVVCSLDVNDEGMDWIPKVKKNEPEEEENVEQFAESQMVSDLLDEQGAATRMVLSSTSARKRKRQVMGKGSSNGVSGINARGPADVDLDNAEWNKLKGKDGNGTEDELDGIEKEIERPSRLSRKTKVSSDSRVQKDLKRVEERSERQKSFSKRSKPVRPLSSSDEIEEIEDVIEQPSRLSRKSKVVTPLSSDDDIDEIEDYKERLSPNIRRTKHRKTVLIEDDSDDIDDDSEPTSGLSRNARMARPLATRRPAPEAKMSKRRKPGTPPKKSGKKPPVAPTSRDESDGRRAAEESSSSRPVSAFAARARIRR